MNSGAVIPFTSPKVQQIAELKARRRGLSVVEYISKLVVEDDNDPWNQPLPQSVAKQWKAEIEKAEHDYQAGKLKAYTDIDELITDLKR
jgi:hypothetical protein